MSSVLRSRRLRGAALACAATVVPLSACATSGGFTTGVKRYVEPTGGSPYGVRALLSAGDRVPRTGHAHQQFQMVGIPDGLGVRRLPPGGAEVYMNSELSNTALAEPIVGAAKTRGAIVSQLRLGTDATVLSADLAYDRVYTENSLVGPAPADNNTTPGFGRFCSGFLGGPDHGYDRPIYFTGEEVSADADSFAPGGGQSVAVFDREIHTLPRLGRFAKENSITLPGIGSRTVIFPTEDGPSTPDSQLYMYVGQKNPQAGSVLGRNGLDNGKLYVLVLDGHSTEADFIAGRAAGRWVEIPDAAALSAEQLEAAADRAGAFGFVRIEDAATRGTDNLFFVTTGGTAGVNELGRGYRLTIKPGNPTAPATLSVVFNADATIAAGGDTAISPDNIDIAGRYLMVQEDGTTQSRAVMAAKGRDGSIWRIDLDAGYTARRIAELNPPGRDGTPVGPGVWESSGIVAAPTYGADSWLLDVQAHPPTAEPSPGTVEDGQLLLLRRKS